MANLVLGSSTQLQLLVAARPVPPASLPAAASCQHPTRPAPLRRLCSFSEPCVELLVASTSSGSPCCILPSPAHGNQTRGLLSGLIRLDGLNEQTVAERLAAVEGHVSNTCAACPTRDARQPSPLVYSPDFGCFLERCLELAQMHKGLGPAPTVLLLQVRYYLHLQVELAGAMELHSEAITPQVALAVFEAWAAMGALPMHSKPFGLALRDHVKCGRFTLGELSRLLAAMAAVRASRPSYRPCQYDVADVCGLLLAAGVRELAPDHLASVAASLGAFPWPVYQCVLPLLHAVAEEAVRRQAEGQMSSSGDRVAAAAVASAAALNPRLGCELEAKVAGWRAAARLASGNNVLGWGPVGHAAEELTASV